MVHQPDELAVTVARQERTVRVLVVVDDLQLEFAPVGHDQDRRVPGEFVGIDPDCRVHATVGPFLGAPDVSGGEQSADCRAVLFHQFRKYLLHSGRRHCHDLLSRSTLPDQAASALSVRSAPGLPRKAPGPLTAGSCSQPSDVVRPADPATALLSDTAADACGGTLATTSRWCECRPWKTVTWQLAWCFFKSSRWYVR